MDLNDIKHNDLEAVLKAQPVRLIMGDKDWITSHDLVNMIKKLAEAISLFAVDIDAASDKMTSHLEGK